MKTDAKPKGKRRPGHLENINMNAAGIDIGSKSHFVAVSTSACDNPVREFSTFTDALHQLADWLTDCGVTTVAMESTGIYWIPVFEILESRGFEVRLVNARHVKNVPGRKSDVLDCQWLQQLHTYGLLGGSFRPVAQICTLRAYVRQRMNLVRYCGSHIQHMQKALAQMNIQLANVVSDITGITGMKIMKAILRGERDSLILAGMRDHRCKNSLETIARSLCGNYRQEHLFSLRQAVDLYEFYQGQIAECDREIIAQLSTFDSADKSSDDSNADQSSGGQSSMDEAMLRISGVDLTLIDGINTNTAIKIIAEIGTDMSRWKTSKHFASWLGLCPGTKITGGKIISARTKKVVNRAAVAMRIAASTLLRSKSALGAYYRRQRSRLGAPKAITATAHKLAKLVYTMLKHGSSYYDAGQDIYEERYRSRVIASLKKRAQEFGLALLDVSGFQQGSGNPLSETENLS